MYCINCGVKMADSEKKCPLCNTVIYHLDFKHTTAHPLYPDNKMPENCSGSKALNGTIIVLFLIPVLVCFFADMSFDGKMEWFGYVAGALIVSYIVFALPRWFNKPNPVIFAPCNFVATALYLLYINLATEGSF